MCNGTFMSNNTNHTLKETSSEMLSAFQDNNI